VCNGGRDSATPLLGSIDRFGARIAPACCVRSAARPAVSDGLHRRVHIAVADQLDVEARRRHP